MKGNYNKTNRFSIDNGQRRVRVSLSRKALEVMKEDIDFFNLKGPSAFIQTVFINFHEESVATISNKLNEYSEEVDSILTTLKIQKKSAEILKLRMLSAKRKELDDRIRQLTKENSECNNYYVGTELVNLISETKKEEAEAHKYPGKYIRVVIEEYAQLPFVKREQIIRKKIYNTVNAEINEKRMLVLTKLIQGKEQTIDFKPYKIITDPLSTQEYLIGYSKLSEEESEYKPASFAMARMEQVKHGPKFKKFTDEEIEKLEESVKTRGAAYLLGEDQRIVVRLTNQGILSYRSRFHNRPVKDISSTEHEYVFYCTEMQAFNFFFSFGSDAEILEPESLRNRFRATYSKALKTYTQKK